MPYVFDFDHAHRRSPMDMKDLLGGKGANLAEMTSVLKLPVPPGFTISTDACRAYMTGGWPTTLDREVARARRRLEGAMGKVIGDPMDPLLVSVRSGAKFSMPGMMDTVLNLGLNDASVEGLAKQTDDERFAYDSYRRFLSMYGRIVLGMASEPFDELLDAAKARFEEEEDPLALQKLQEALQIEPDNTTALSLKTRIEKRRSERQIDNWYRLAKQHIDNHAYPHAREARSEEAVSGAPMFSRPTPAAPTCTADGPSASPPRCSVPVRGSSGRWVSVSATPSTLCW